MDIIKYKYLFIGFSAILTVAAVASMLVFGFKAGIDFAGGTLWQLRFSNPAPGSVLPIAYGGGLQEVEKLLLEKKMEGVSVRSLSDSNEVLIRMKEISEEQHQDLYGSLKEKFGEAEELSFSSIGPAIGRELRNKSATAFLLVLAGISLYVAFAFRKVSYPVSSWKYGLVTLITLFHDALIPAGFFSFLGWKFGAEADINLIVAILVVMGFSVHDTIVVFDRIRENLLNSKDKENLAAIINASVNQTFSRSVNTSLTLVLVLLALYFWGAETLKHFTLLILLGTIIGTYSSIFVASPLLTFFHKKRS